ncbi:MAG: hypothetical protein HC898_07830 [Phycisphaerales bacterium]|nr:hypothetical protein [Phycisphaerales bacterium]
MITLDRWEKILSTSGSIPMRELARVQGINHNEHGQPVVLLALLREAVIQ